MRSHLDKSILFRLLFIIYFMVGLSDGVAIAGDYSGKYIRETENESADIVINKLNNGKYHIKGFALWGTKSTNAPHTGELDFISRINKGSIHYTCYKGIWKGKKEYYVLDIEFHKNGLVVKEKNWAGFFGMNVQFIGEYIKK